MGRRITRLMRCPVCEGVGSVPVELIPGVPVEAGCQECCPVWLRIGAGVKVRGRINPNGKLETGDGNEFYLGAVGVVVEHDPRASQGNVWTVDLSDRRRVRFRPW